jgi:hypothetical protein
MLMDGFEDMSRQSELHWWLRKLNQVVERLVDFFLGPPDPDFAEQVTAYHKWFHQSLAEHHALHHDIYVALVTFPRFEMLMDGFEDMSRQSELHWWLRKLNQVVGWPDSSLSSFQHLIHTR